MEIQEKTVWEEAGDYIKEIKKTIESNNKKRFKKLLGYSFKQSFRGCPELKEELFEIINKGCNKFKLNA